MKTLVLLVLAMTPLMAMSQNNKQMNEFDPNFAHVVYFWFKNPDNTADRAKFEKSLHTFLQNSKYAKTNFVGTSPKAVRDVVDDSFTYNLIVTFDSAKAQAAYQDEEAHHIFIEECKDLWEKVIVYDANGTVQ